MPGRKRCMNLIGLCGVGLLLGMAAQAGAQVRFASQEPGNVFLDGEAVRFTAEGGGPRVRVRVMSYTGQVVKEGEFPASAISLGKLPRGYYEILPAEIEGRALPTPFVVVPRPHPRAEGRPAVDAALSWLVPTARYEEGAELLRRAGFLWVRDRLSWGEVEPERGKFAWGRYDRSASAQAKRGLNVYQVFHDTPKWARADGATNRFPDDLRDAYQFARAAARHFRGKVKAWEVWNEADIPAFSVDPGSEYAAFLKAIYLGFKAEESNLPITQVSFALAPGRFAQSLVENGAAAYYDIYNYHIYDNPQNYAARARSHRELMRKSGAVGRPVWLTEAGIPLRAVDGTLTPEDKRRQAEFIPKSYVESLAHGTDKHFFFVFPHYLENGVEFGTLTADLKPYPGYAALATLTDALGAAIYLGEIRFRQPGLHLHVFNNGEGETLMAWSDRPGVRVPLSLAPFARKQSKALQTLDVVGTPHPMETDARNGVPVLTLSSAPVYLLLPQNALPEVVPPPSAPNASSAEAPPPRYGLRGIVVRLRLPQARPDKEAQAFRLRSRQPTTVEAQVYNFGGREFTGTLLLTPPEGWALNRRAVAITDLPPMGRQVETLTLTLESRGAAGRKLLRGVARAAYGEQSSPAVVDVIVE
ncbi:MAG TPA: hypothetical protein VFB38_11240 [Chthonomonadaceae bacterium]|nr:hypothetical protein [Chthonomonadaceae bacterium]